MKSRLIFAPRSSKSSRDGRWFNRSSQNDVCENLCRDRHEHNFNASEHPDQGRARLSAPLPKLLIVPLLAVGVLATTAAFAPTDTDVPLLQTETASADYQEVCYTVPSTTTETEWIDTNYGGGGAPGYWRTYTVTEYVEYCHHHGHNHIVDTIVVNVAAAILCGGIGFLAGGPIGSAIGAGLCSVIVATVLYVWGPYH